MYEWCDASQLQETVLSVSTIYDKSAGNYPSFLYYLTYNMGSLSGKSKDLETLLLGKSIR